MINPDQGNLNDLISANDRLKVVKERLDEWVRRWGAIPMNQVDFYDCWKQIKNIAEGEQVNAEGEQVNFAPGDTVNVTLLSTVQEDGYYVGRGLAAHTDGSSVELVTRAGRSYADGDVVQGVNVWVRQSGSRWRSPDHNYFTLSDEEVRDDGMRLLGNVNRIHDVGAIKERLETLIATEEMKVVINDQFPSMFNIAANYSRRSILSQLKDIVEGIGT